MIHSVHTHMPVVLALIALLLVLIVATQFIAVRVFGQRLVNDEALEAKAPPPDDVS